MLRAFVGKQSINKLAEATASVYNLENQLTESYQRSVCDIMINVIIKTVQKDY
jgi:hypothetical protein